jgi:uncharacterized protein (DUF1810 family)
MAKRYGIASLAEATEPVFSQCLERYYAGVPDPRTLSLCAAAGG